MVSEITQPERESTTINYTYDPLNRLTNIGDVDYTWDNNGHLLSEGVNTQTYNSANQLTGFNEQDPCLVCV